MKFYVNEISDYEVYRDLKFDRGQYIIGLFSQCNTEGRGDFCGYYGSEFYLNTKLYAYYMADCKGLYRPEKRLSDVIALEQPIDYREIGIGSHMWTNVIEADSVEEAIKLFTDAKWRRWQRSKDECIGGIRDE